MDLFYRIANLLGGLSLFLYGMRILGDGLKSSSGSAMRAALSRVTDTTLKGFFLGLLVTCMIQSSTATIVLTVGLVGAGFLTFRKSVGIVLGANVGTAITAQIIRLMDVDAGTGSLLYFFKSDNLSAIALICGIILIMFVNTRSSNAVGTILMGFGILFVGLMNMSSAVSSFGDSLSSLLITFEGNYFLGFLAGVLVTGVIQSSSAVIGILQTLASTVGVTFKGIIAVVIGVNIGDCLTTYLVCRIGANREQIRTCFFHIVYNIAAAILIVAVVSILRVTNVLNDSIWYMTLRSGGVADVHGIFRLVPAILLLPFSGRLADLTEKMIPMEEEDTESSKIEENLRELDSHLIENPTVALAESRQLIGHMADVAVHNVDASLEQLKNFDSSRAQRIASREDLLDRMADAANRYIVDISPHITLERDTIEQSLQYKALSCFERIGDHAMNIEKYVEELNEADKSFSPDADDEIAVAAKAVFEILSMTVEAYKEEDEKKASEIEPLEEVIDEIVVTLRDHHTSRIVHNTCDVFAGFEYQNILTSLERISDQCSDIAVYILGRNDKSISGHEHQYIENIHHFPTPEYKNSFNRYYEKYFELILHPKREAK